MATAHPLPLRATRAARRDAGSRSTKRSTSLEATCRPPRGGHRGGQEASAAACCEHCTRTRGCRGWTYVKKERTCWAKGTIVKTTGNTYVVSGILRGIESKDASALRTAAKAINAVVASGPAAPHDLKLWPLPHTARWTGGWRPVSADLVLTPIWSKPRTPSKEPRGRAEQAGSGTDSNTDPTRARDEGILRRAALRFVPRFAALTGSPYAGSDGGGGGRDDGGSVGDGSNARHPGSRNESQVAALREITLTCDAPPRRVAPPGHGTVAGDHNGGANDDSDETGGRGEGAAAGGGGGGVDGRGAGWRMETDHPLLVEGETLIREESAAFRLEMAAGQSVGTVVATNVFGCLAGLETLSQVCFGGWCNVSALSIADYPELPIRGLMVDAGRRFVPVPALEAIIDTMALVHLNVLHLHLTDWAAVRWESAAFPTLNMAPPLSGRGRRRFYSRRDIVRLGNFARDRGVVIVPEIDIPGHSSGFLPLRGGTQRGGGSPHSQGLRQVVSATSSGARLIPKKVDGRSVPHTGNSKMAHGTDEEGAAGAEEMHFCDERGWQLYDDPGGDTRRVLRRLIHELAALFPRSPVLHIGADEADAVGPCTHSNIKGLVEEVQKSVLGEGRQPMAWNEALTVTGAALPDTIIQCWKDCDTAAIMQEGRPVVVSLMSKLYLDATLHACPLGRLLIGECLWFDLRRHIWGPRRRPPASADEGDDEFLLQGATTSMWTDEFCPKEECPGHGDNWGGRAGYMYHEDEDDRFNAALLSVIWPRAALAAGSFWRFSDEVGREGNGKSSSPSAATTAGVGMDKGQQEAAELLRRYLAIAGRISARLAESSVSLGHGGGGGFRRHQGPAPGNAQRHVFEHSCPVVGCEGGCTQVEACGVPWNTPDAVVPTLLHRRLPGHDIQGGERDTQDAHRNGPQPPPPPTDRLKWTQAARHIPETDASSTAAAAAAAVTAAGRDGLHDDDGDNEEEEDKGGVGESKVKPRRRKRSRRSPGGVTTTDLSSLPAMRAAVREIQEAMGKQGAKEQYLRKRHRILIQTMRRFVKETEEALLYERNRGEVLERRVEGLEHALQNQKNGAPSV